MPPANDERPHRYVFDVYSIDVRSLGLSGLFDGVAAESAMRGHVLARGSATTLYDRRGAR